MKMRELEELNTIINELVTFGEFVEHQWGNANIYFQRRSGELQSIITKFNNIHESLTEKLASMKLIISGFERRQELMDMDEEHMTEEELDEKEDPREPYERKEAIKSLVRIVQGILPEAKQTAED